MVCRPVEQWEADLTVKTQWDWPGVRNRELSRATPSGLGQGYMWVYRGTHLGLALLDACLGGPRILEDQAYGKTREQMLLETARVIRRHVFPKLMPQPHLRPFQPPLQSQLPCIWSRAFCTPSQVGRHQRAGDTDEAVELEATPPPQ